MPLTFRILSPELQAALNEQADAIREQTDQLSAITNALEDGASTLYRIEQLIRKALKPPPHTPVLSVTFQKEEAMNLEVYKLTADAPTDSDVVSRKLTVSIDGTASEPQQFPGDATELGEVRAPQGSAVVVTLVDTDDAGNESAPATLSFTAQDLQPPAGPGGVTAGFVREDFVADPAPPA